MCPLEVASTLRNFPRKSVTSCSAPFLKPQSSGLRKRQRLCLSQTTKSAASLGETIRSPSPPWPLGRPLAAHRTVARPWRPSLARQKTPDAMKKQRIGFRGLEPGGLVLWIGVPRVQIPSQRLKPQTTNSGFTASSQGCGAHFAPLGLLSQ